MRFLIFMACDLYISTCPKPGDQSINLLGKILQVLNNGGGSGGGGSSSLKNFVDSADGNDAEIYGLSGSSLLAAFAGATGFFKLYNQTPGQGSRIILDVNTEMLSLIGGMAKDNAAYLDISGDSHPTTAGYVAARIKGTGKFTVRQSDFGLLSPVIDLLEVDSAGISVNRAFTTAVVTLTDAATVATDASLGNHFRVTLEGNRTLGNPTNPVDGQKAIWEFVQDGVGNRTIALDTDFNFGTDVTGVTLSTAAGARDLMFAIYNSTAGVWDVLAFDRGY